MLYLNAAGGLALFMLAMQMMTNGLKGYAGSELKNILHHWTKTPLRGLLSGILLAAVVQSSSAVTVATIGFVNAGILSMAQSLAVIFGINIGTTMTGWLVSLMGFGFKIEAFSMPLIALGVALRFLAPTTHYRALGEALAGFGLFFLGLIILKESFSIIAETYGTALLTREGNSLFLFVLIGFAATFLTQSSSASIAVIMLATSQSVMGLEAAAAAIIGANVGTTTTALLASLGATANARRLAAGHVLFNVGTACVALIVLDPILLGVAALTDWLEFKHNLVVQLAVFHTFFNILGVLLFLPFLGQFSRFLEGLFHTAEEDLSRPQYLDKTTLSTPSVAVSALWQELAHLNRLVCQTGVETFEAIVHPPQKLAKKTAAIATLSQTISDFTLAAGMEKMPEETSESLLRVLRVSRYLEDVVEGISGMQTLQKQDQTEAAQKLIAPLLPALAEMFAALEVPVSPRKANAAQHKIEAVYNDTKAAVLKAAVLKKLQATEANTLLDTLSQGHHATQQLVKANRMLTQNILPPHITVAAHQPAASSKNKKAPS